MDKKTLGFLLMAALLILGGYLTLWFEQRRIDARNKAWADQRAREAEQARAFADSEEDEWEIARIAKLNAEDELSDDEREERKA